MTEVFKSAVVFLSIGFVIAVVVLTCEIFYRLISTGGDLGMY